VHPDAPANPLYDDLKDFFDIENSLPNDFRLHSKLRHIQIAEHNEAIVKSKVLETQSICLPTLNNLRNQRNISQLQERVYQRFTKYFDALNICILRSRTNEEADHCFNQFQTSYDNTFRPELKKILLDY
jgi:hypothetical protein